jgi:NAD-dependent dihydropyrimidine dehydrogenase PreA subunit
VIAPAPEFHRTRCVRYRYRYSECRRCLDACPHQAIALTDDGLLLDAGKCAKCALCTTACRTAALVPANLARVDLLTQAIKKSSRFSFACMPSGASADATVPCLGAIDAVMLAYLGKRGIETELRGADHCGACEHGSRGTEVLAANCTARDLLEDACGGEDWSALVVAESSETPPTGDFRAGRRQLFRRLIGKGIEEATAAASLRPLELPVADKAIRPGPWLVPEMRELLQIVGRRADLEGCYFPLHTALPAANIELASGCSNCEACLRSCPTGALQARESDNDWRLLFFADRCVGCGVCTEVCQPRVLRSANRVDATPGAQPLVLRVLAKQRCQRCDRFFVSGVATDTCVVCADDNDAFGRIFG